MEIDNGTLAVLSIIWIMIIFALISDPEVEQKRNPKAQKEVLYLNCDTIYVDKKQRNISGTIVKTVIL